MEPGDRRRVLVVGRASPGRSVDRAPARRGAVQGWRQAAADEAAFLRRHIGDPCVGTLDARKGPGSSPVIGYPGTWGQGVGATRIADCDEPITHRAGFPTRCSGPVSSSSTARSMSARPRSADHRLAHGPSWPGPATTPIRSSTHQREPLAVAEVNRTGLPERAIRLHAPQQEAGLLSLSISASTPDLARDERRLVCRRPTVSKGRSSARDQSRPSTESDQRLAALAVVAITEREVTIVRHTQRRREEIGARSNTVTVQLSPCDDETTIACSQSPPSTTRQPEAMKPSGPAMTEWGRTPPLAYTSCQAICGPSVAVDTDERRRSRYRCRRRVQLPL